MTDFAARSVVQLYVSLSKILISPFFSCWIRFNRGKMFSNFVVKCKAVAVLSVSATAKIDILILIQV